MHVYIEHRIGSVDVSESNIVIAVSSGHRKCAFRACEAIMDTIKARLPIWKKEVFDDGSTRWLVNAESH